MKFKAKRFVLQVKDCFLSETGSLVRSARKAQPFVTRSLAIQGFRRYFQTHDLPYASEQWSVAEVVWDVEQ